MPDQPKTPQFNVRVPEDLRREGVAIAKLKQERDELGFGLSVVVRRAIKQYVARNRNLLEHQDD